jgi:glycosyltransferase involved in cell wall biosynthesis
MALSQEQRIAILIPCFNEAATIGKVVDDFRSALPAAKIYVFDNCSTDDSARIAAEHGAEVMNETRKGKGFVVESMFERIEADFYVMVDGDDTYPADCVHKLLEPVMSGQADMAVGARLSDYTSKSFRPMHVFGNNLVRRLVNHIGGTQLTDIMSGYRAFNRRIVDCIPVVSSRFEIETEMTIQMIYYRRKIVEVAIPYKERPGGSRSKLRTIPDGYAVLRKIFHLFRAFKPLIFFGSMGVVFFLLGLLAGLAPINDYFTNPDHYVEHVPLAVLAAGLMLLSMGFVFLGVLLHSLNSRFREMHSVITRGRLRLAGRHRDNPDMRQYGWDADEAGQE